MFKEYFFEPKFLYNINILIALKADYHLSGIFPKSALSHTLKLNCHKSFYLCKKKIQKASIKTQSIYSLLWKICIIQTNVLLTIKMNVKTFIWNINCITI